MWGTEEYKVRIRFTARVAPYIEEREWHPSQKIKKSKDGGLLLSFTTNHLNEVKDWALSWGPSANVLAPVKLVEKMRAATHKAAAHYQ